MKLFISKYILVFLFSLSLIHSAQGQEKKPIFLGAQPGVTQEKSYSDNEFDVNVFPLVFQTAMCKRFDIRLTSIVNYHSGGDENGFSDIGINIVAPFFFRKKEDGMEASYGIYLGPVLGLGNNFLDEHGTLTTALEGGYMFRADKKFTLALGMQLGGSYFIYDTQPNTWTNHFGIKINLGWWLRKN